MRVLLVSTYELGHQPLGVAGPAAALRRAGHETHACDVSLDGLDAEAVRWADAVAFSVPMHTALRLALPLVERVRAARPDIPIALHGLYAGVAGDHRALAPGDLLVAGETDDALVEWAGRRRHTAPAGPPRVAVALGRARPAAAGPPERAGLPTLERYARLVTADGERLAGYVEASRGCSHRCRHCPVPVVYDGRTRPVDAGDVLADVAGLVAAGATHLTFGDPDFLNRPAHSLDVVRRIHEAHPDLTFDVTVKVEHILRHESLWPELAAKGCLFVVSAFESVDDRVLALLDKGHTRADAVRALAVLRAVWIEPRPSLLPFTPWTRLADLVDLVRFVAEHDLVPNVDPVQYGIRLLLPPGSLLLADPDPQLAEALRGYDAAALSWTWASADPRVEELQQLVATIAEEAGGSDEVVGTTFGRIAEAVWRAAECAGELPADAGEAPPPAPDVTAAARPRLSEAWYCCAEPTRRQLAGVEPA